MRGDGSAVIVAVSGAWSAVARRLSSVAGRSKRRIPSSPFCKIPGAHRPRTYAVKSVRSPGYHRASRAVNALPRPARYRCGSWLTVALATNYPYWLGRVPLARTPARTLRSRGCSPIRRDSRACTHSRCSIRRPQRRSITRRVTDEHQFFKGSVGPGGPQASQRGTPWSRSRCQHVVATDVAAYLARVGQGGYGLVANQARVGASPTYSARSTVAG